MTTKVLTLTGLAVLTALFSVTGATAQEWRGMGRVGGKVVDEAGKPVEGVAVKAMMSRAGNRGPESQSNANGEWAVGGIAGGIAGAGHGLAQEADRAGAQTAAVKPASETPKKSDPPKKASERFDYQFETGEAPDTDEGRQMD